MALQTLEPSNVHDAGRTVSLSCITTAAYAVVLGLAASHHKEIPSVQAHADKTFHENLFIMMGKVEQVKRRERRLFGYGHRVHKAEDPRLAIIKGLLDELDVTPAKNPLMGIAREIDRVAAGDEYFTSRGLRANADFYFGFLIDAFGFDPDMVILANLAMRILGLMAHWREAMDQEVKIFRPLHIYTGPEPGEERAKL
ncbi:citrate synthase-like protein [Xylariomycetidae sp. FL2044]|nr:citrate synthase-like protein [Xylariomycetidae sp. FL2044]